MFLGTHTPRLDEKGRLILPAKFRDELADGLVITRGQERCLAIWPMEVFVALARTAAERLVQPAAGPGLPADARLGSLGRDAGQAGADHHPAAPAGYAGLDKDCVVVGAMNRVEVWDAAAWNAYSAEQESAFAEHERRPCSRGCRARPQEHDTGQRVVEGFNPGLTPWHNFPGAR